MSRINFLFSSNIAIAAGMASLAVTTIDPEAVMAKSPSQIAQMAIPVTVQINSVAGGGSGVIINQNTDQGETVYSVLTANHVVRNAAIGYEVRTHTGQSYTVISVEHFQKNDQVDPDLALVKFKSDHKYPVASLGDSSRAGFGDPINIFGYPFTGDNQLPDKRSFVYSPGELNNPQRKGPNGYDWLYNAVTQKGMSGGPVFNQDGKVVAIHGRGERFQDKAAFNSGIPINTFLALAPDFVKLPQIVNSPQPNALATVNNNSTSSWESGPGYETAAKDPYEDEDRYAGASHFYCDLNGAVPRTIAKNVVNSQTLDLIHWEEDPNFKWSVNQAERCQVVSGRFQRAYYENKLHFLVVGQINKYPVICGVTDADGTCNKDNILITFQPSTDATAWLNNFISGNTGTVRGGGAASAGFKDMRNMLSELQDTNLF